MKKQHHQLLYFFLFLNLLACQVETKKQNSNTLNIRQAEDASGLNPLTIRDGFSNYLSMQLFQTLVGIDFKTKEVVGIVAEEAGKTTKIDSQTVKIDFQIRPEARFDNGKSIQAEDVIFSTKLHLLQGIKSYTSRFFSFIKNVHADSANPQKVYFLASSDQRQAAFYCGSIYLLDESVYDPKGLLSKYSISEVKADSIYQIEEVKTLIDQLNNQQYAKNPKFIKGSGPYKIIEWNQDKNIRLAKKQNWWGEEVKSMNSFLNVIAPEINYEIINDENTAIVSLKNGRIDLMSEISPRLFNRLKEDQNFNQEYTLETAPKMGYHCLGFNLNHPMLSDKKIRQAIAHCLNTDLFIEKVLYGLAEKTNGPLSPRREKTYNSTLKSITYDLDKAKMLFNSTKWAKADEPLRLEYAYNAGNKEREALGLILKEEAAKVGIEIQVAAYEWSVYLQKLKNGELQLFYSAVSSSLLPPNYSNSFHSSAAEGGRNYFNYKNQKADSLIAVMNSSKDSNKYNTASKAFQELLLKDLPCIFLYSEKETFAYSKAIEHFYPTEVRPHYWAPALSKN